MSSEPANCPECGAALPASLAGLCPRCVWGESMASDGGDGLLPGHSLGEELARGGMGIVYAARQWSPPREVAVKMLRPHLLEQEAMKDRFRQEAQAAAALQHPGILPVYEVGESDGIPWFTMMLAEGGTLSARRADFVGKWRETATLLAHLARAVGHAHERGVLHRDLKPGNILFDREGRAYVCDFGLAKVATAGDTTPDWTLSVQLLGTPHYLPPEVAAGTMKLATTAGDIYALGVILYELLAGRLPFDAENVPALLRKIADEDPSTPVARPPVARRSETGLPPLPSGSTPIETRSATVEREVPAVAGLLQPVSERRATGERQATGTPPADLSAIAMKCLEKNPARRYATAPALADDLEAWLAGKPVTARRLTRRQKFGRWVRRNPLVTGLTAALLATIAAGVVLGIRRQFDLERALATTTLSEARFRSLSSQAGRRFEVVEALGRVRDTAPPADLRSRLAAALAAPDMKPLNDWPVHLPNVMTQMDFTADLSHFAAPVPEGGVGLFDTATQSRQRHFPAPPAELILGAQLTADGQWLGFVTDTGRVELHRTSGPGASHVVQGELKDLTRFVFRPDSRACLIISSRLEGTMLDFETSGRRPLPWTVWPDGKAGVVYPSYARFSPDGEKIALIRTKAVQVIRAADGTEVWGTLHGYLNSTLAWSPDGAQLVVSESELLGVLSMHDAATGKETRIQTPARTRPHHVVFLPDGQSLLLVAWGGKVTWMSVSREGPTPVEMPAATHALCLSADGRRLGYAPAAGRLGIAELSPSPVLQRWLPPRQEHSRGFLSAVSPDGRWLGVAEMSGIRLYSVGVRRQAAWLPLPDSEWHRSICFSADSRSFYTGSMNAPLLHFTFREESGSLLVNAPRVVAENAPTIQEFAANGRDLVILKATRASQNGRTADVTGELWQDADPAKARTLFASGHGRDMVGFRLVPNTSWGVSGSLLDPDILLWDTDRGRFVRGLGLPQKASCDIARNGRHLITFCAGEYRLWDTATWQPTARWAAQGDFHGGAKFMPDSQSVIVPSGMDGLNEIRRVPDGQFLAALPLCGVVTVKEVLPGPDGQRLYLRTEYRQIIEWDLAALEKAWADHGVPVR